MTASQYWEGDSALTRYFREAYELKQEQRDYEFWQQGMYFYDALQTAMFNSFRKKNEKARNYPDKPYLQTAKEQKKVDEQQRRNDKIRAWMEGLVILYDNK